MAADTTSTNLVTPDALLKHWQGHRKLTRRTIDAFPEDKLFQYSLGGMRTFGEIAAEFLAMEVPTVDGLLTGSWESFSESKPESKARLLDAWDAQTEHINTKFPQIPVETFAAIHKAFGQWEMPGIVLIQYVIDNQIHHRGQGYVYLRSLGIEPPPFWDRS